MKKRLIAAVIAGVLALLGVVVLVAWANKAEDRAYKGADLVNVVRVTTAVEAGTKADDLAASTEIAKLPSDAVPAGAVKDLASVAGLAATTTLQPGEVLLKSRLAAPGDKGSGAIDVPKGYQEISISLEAQRAVADSVKAGGHVGVFVNFEPKGNGPQFGNLVRHNVLVTKVGLAASGEKGVGSMITLAVKTQDAQKIAFAMEFGKIWLTAQNADTEMSGEKVITGEDFVK